MRSFGVIQSTTIVEGAMEVLAERLGKDPTEVRFINFYNQGDETPYGQSLDRCNMKGVWSSLKGRINYSERKAAIAEFNRNNTWKKKGMSLIPLKYGISFTRISANQVSASVQVFNKDGSIIVSHGGIEMGQGLYTKLQQIASYEIGVTLSAIQVQPYSSHSIVNAPSTGASTGTDLNGGAVQLACRDLVNNLKTCLEKYFKNKSAVKLPKPVADTLDDLEKKWNDLPEEKRTWKTEDNKYWRAIVSLAYETRTNLAGHGFFASPGISEVVDGKGDPFYYFNYAAAYSEVEIDVLTGEHIVHYTNIVYDAGESLNPAIDIGQVEGGFIQGLGNMTSEELVYNKDGKLTTNGTWEYKVPCSRSIPIQFDVALWPSKYDHDQLGLTNPTPRVGPNGDPIPGVAGIQSAKTTGEPPLVLANTVYFAIRDAVRSYRIEHGLDVSSEWRMDPPATIAQIQRACNSMNDPDYMRNLAEKLKKLSN